MAKLVLKKIKTKTPKTVYLDDDNLEFIDRVELETNLNRSDIINQIINSVKGSYK